MRKRELFFGLMVLVGLVAGNASGWTAHSYVQKGLKASYDGIDNAGTGTHDSTSAIWKDLTGNGYDGTLASTVSWESNCWVTTASDRQVKLPNNFSYITATRTFTVDCAISPSRGEKNNAARETIFGQYDGNNKGTFNIEHNHGSHQAGCLRIYLNLGQIDKFGTGAVLADQNATVTMTVAPSNQVLYIDGTSDIVSTTSLTALYSSKDTYIGGEPSRANMGFQGRYYGCRVYDRDLTAAEVGVNHAVDAIRFWGASTNDFTLSGGYSFDGAGGLLVDLTAVADAGGKVGVGTDGAAASSASSPVNQDGTDSATFTAVADEGYEFATWVLEDGATITAGNRTDPTISVSARWPLAVTATFREKGKLTAYSYVQKGLVACWDGIDNAGTGVHDATVRTWKDLTGNGYDGTLGSNVTWAENGWQNEADEKPVALGMALSGVTATRDFTVEFAVTPSRAPCREVLFGQFNWDDGSINLERRANGKLRCFFNNAEVDFDSAAVLVQNETASFTVTATPGRQAAWKNGVLATAQTAKTITALFSSKPTYIGAEQTGDDGRKSFNFHGTYHACRVYDHALTDAEITVNNAVDAIRYRGATAGDFTLSDGYAFDASGNLTVAIEGVATAGGKVRVGAGAAAATVTATVNQDGALPAYFTAEPDAGYEFVMWNIEEGGILLDGSASDATVGVSSKWPLAVTAIFRPVRASAFATTEGADYVKNGLQVWYDGVDNAGVGQHGGAAAGWTDLSGNGNDAVAVAPGLGWTANACTNNAEGLQSGDGGLFRLGNAVAPIIAARTFTLEMAFTPNFAKSRSVLFGSYDGAVGFNLEETDAGTFRIFYNNRPNIVSTVPLMKDEEVVISLVSTTNSAVIYRNGVAVYRYDGAIDETATLAAIADPAYYLGGEKLRNGFAFRGAIHSFRLYDRALTSAEVLRNTRLDQRRLFTRTTSWTNAAGGSWLDAASWSDSLPHAEMPANVTLDGANVQVGLAQTALNPAGVSLGNAVGTTKLTLGSGATLPLSDASLALGAGSELSVEAGALVRSAATGTKPDPLLSVADGGRLSIDGGVVKLETASTSILVFGDEGRTGTLAIASGRLDATVAATAQHGVSVLSGGRLEMTGGSLTLVRPAGYSEGSGLLLDGGEIDLSGTATLAVQRKGIRLGPGNFHMGGTARILQSADNYDTVSAFRLRSAAGKETVLTVDDAANIMRIDGTRLNVYLSDNIAGSRAVLNWNSTKTLNALSTLAVGFQNGYGELNISRGQVVGGEAGARVGQGASNVNSGCFPTGVVNITGGSLRNGKSSNNDKTFQGLIIGAGTCVNLANPGFYRGTINLYNGAVTNTSEYFGIGIGCSEGDLNQYAGEVIHDGNENEFVIGAFGGKGSMVMEGGRAWSKSAVYVGGATTNNLYYKRYNLYTQCPVTNHCATGLLRVTNGRFDSANTIWVSQDGQGTLEIGPAGAVSANDVVLTNTPAALTGAGDLAAKLAFTFDANGVGSLTVTNKLTIGTGVTMDVDATALNGRGATVPLILCGESEGEFSAINVEGKGAVRKMSVDGAFGYWYQHVPGTYLIVK